MPEFTARHHERYALLTIELQKLQVLWEDHIARIIVMLISRMQDNGFVVFWHNPAVMMPVGPMAAPADQQIETHRFAKHDYYDPNTGRWDHDKLFFRVAKIEREGFDATLRGR